MCRVKVANIIVCHFINNTEAATAEQAISENIRSPCLFGEPRFPRVREELEVFSD